MNLTTIDRMGELTNSIFSSALQSFFIPQKFFGNSVTFVFSPRL